MYESFFGLTGSPFRLTPDPSFLFIGKGHHEAFAALRGGLAGGARVMVLTGEVGAGKTTLVQALLASVDPATTLTAHISAAHLDAETLSGRLFEALGLPPEPDTLARRDALLAALASGARTTLMLIDEAQHLAPSALDLIEILANATALTRVPLQICLVGQPELRILLNAVQRDAFRELIGVDRHLRPLEQAEIRLYVEHRLRRAGWTGRPEFEDAAFSEIFIFTAGNPRRINLLCNSLMLCACGKRQQKIDAPAVTWAAAAMREDALQGEPDVLDLGSHFEHRPTLKEAFRPQQPELEPASLPAGMRLDSATAPPGEAASAPEETAWAAHDAQVEAETSAAAADVPRSPTMRGATLPVERAIHLRAGVHHGATEFSGSNPAPDHSRAAVQLNAEASVTAADVRALMPPGDGTSPEVDVGLSDLQTRVPADAAAEPSGEASRRSEETGMTAGHAVQVDAEMRAGAADAPAYPTLGDGALPEVEVALSDLLARVPPDAATDPFGEAPRPPVEAGITAGHAVQVDAEMSAAAADAPAYQTLSDGALPEVEVALSDLLARVPPVAATDPSGEAPRPPEETGTTAGRAVQVHAEISAAADAPASQAVDDGTSPQVEVARSDLLAKLPSDASVESPGAVTPAPQEHATGADDRVQVHAETSLAAADALASPAMRTESSPEAKLALSERLTGLMRHRLGAARRRRHAILASVALTAVAIALFAYVVEKQYWPTTLSPDQLRNIAAKRTTAPAPPETALEPLRRAVGAVAPASSAQAASPAPSPEVASRLRNIEAAPGTAPQDGADARGRIGAGVPGIAEATPGHVVPAGSAAAKTSPPCSGPAFALGLCDADSSSTPRH